ncbi:MAG: ribbon-helix-helix domain-containing protein [Patescibacteria group bacterium]|nr:ribbon-helix-helix domain-containing protein [Patescibacteria group bacterium]
MTTINISLPVKLKSQAEFFVKSGYYASFSDLVRDSIRRLVERNKYDLWADEAKEDLKKGRAKILKSSKEIDDYFKKI